MLAVNSRYPPKKAAGTEPIATGKNTLKLKNLCRINRKLPTDETMILRIKPIGFIIFIGVPINDMIAIYDDAPAVPNRRVQYGPKKNEGCRYVIVN